MAATIAKTKLHHKKSNICTSRPKYREARWERAVKVYTINLESKYLLVQGIPALGVTKDLLETFAIYGVIDEYRILDDYPAEEFTSVYWIKFQHIMAARKAKRKLDNRSFFGGIIHVSYAPEFETVEETREKLMDRKRVVERKIKSSERESGGAQLGQVEQHKRAEQQQRVEQPAWAERPTRVEQPAWAEQPTRVEQPAWAERPTRVEQPAWAERPTRVEQPAWAERPTRVEQPAWDEQHKLVQQPFREQYCIVPETSTRYPENSHEVYTHMPTRLPALSVPAYPSQFSTLTTSLNHDATSTCDIPSHHTHTITQTKTVLDQKSNPNRKDNLHPQRIPNERTETGDKHVAKEREAVIQSHPAESLTGNPSLDRTVLSIREKLNQIKNSRQVNLRSENVSAAEQPKRPLKQSDGAANQRKKKQRKRI